MFFIIFQFVRDIRNKQIISGSMKRNKRSFRMVRNYISDLIIIIFLQILILHGTFLLCWTPYALQSTVGILGLDEVK